MDWMELALIGGAGIFAGFVNTVAGGGSLLILPMLIFLGLPPAAANATNRVAVLVQSFAGAAAFEKNKLIDYKLAIPLGISSSIGAVLGASLSLEINEALFNKIIAVVIVVVVIMMLVKSKTYTPEQALNSRNKWVGIIFFFFIGIYGGFLQAGIGFIMMAALNRYYMIDLVRTNALKVVIVLIYTVFALVVFIWSDLIYWKIGLILAAGNALGAWWAGIYSIRKGEKGIKIVVALMAVAMAVKLWIDS